MLFRLVVCLAGWCTSRLPSSAVPLQLSVVVVVVVVVFIVVVFVVVVDGNNATVVICYCTCSLCGDEGFCWWWYF